MNLKNINVLVDGYNLELQQGTGIKTYGISLVKALHYLEAEIDILFSFFGKKKFGKDPVLTEALFFDRASETISNLTRLKLSLKAIAGFNYQAKQLNFADIVIRDKQDFVKSQILEYAKAFNAPNCYNISNAIFKQINYEIKIKSPSKIDIWHCTYPLPISIVGAKKITTIHDLIPLRLPYTTLDDKQFFYNLVHKSIKKSDLIVTVSEHSKQDLINIFNIPPEKVEVTYQPIALERKLASEEELSYHLKKYNLLKNKYLLFVGAIEPKKNLGRLIDAYASMQLNIPLVVVGKKGWLWENEIGKLEGLFGKNFQKKVPLLDYVSNRDLPYLYQGAYCFIFPSLYEGFGLPPLEAMSFGCPVITSNVSSLPEVCGDAALYIDPYNLDDTIEKIKLILENSELRRKLIDAGKERAKFFSMENYLSRLNNAYYKVLNK